jgi:hypothetical protein
MIPRARPGRPVAGSARPTQQQAQLTGKFGARGLKDPFEMESELKGITPPPRIMDQYMREWKTRQASMNPETYRANGRRSKAEQMAYLGAMMKEQYQQDKQNEVNILSDKFAKDFMCWLNGDDPKNPGDPAYVRDRMQLAGYNIKQPTRMRGEGVDEYLASFLDKKSEFVKKWTRIRMGPHRAFKWNLGHFYLFYKYFLRNAPYTEDELLSDFDCFYPDLSGPRDAQPYRELGHKDMIFYDGQRPRLEPHSAFCGTEAPTNQQPPVTVKNQPSVPEPPGPPSNIQQAQKQDPGASVQIKPEPGQPSSQPQPQPPPQGPNTQVVAGPLPQYPVNAPQAAGVPAAPMDIDNVPVSNAPVAQPEQPNLQSGQTQPAGNQPVVDPALAAEFQQAAQAQFQELANRLEIAQQELDEHKLRRQTGEGFSLVAYGRALQQVTRLKNAMEGVQSTYTGQTSSSSTQNPPALPTPPTADVPRIEKSHGAVDLKEDRMVPVQGSGAVVPKGTATKESHAMVLRSASNVQAIDAVNKIKSGNFDPKTLRMVDDAKKLIGDDGSAARASLTAPKGALHSLVKRQSLRVRTQVAAKESALAVARGRSSMDAQATPQAIHPPLTDVEMREAPPLPLAPPAPRGKKRKEIEPPPERPMIEGPKNTKEEPATQLTVARVMKTAKDYSPYFVGAAEHGDVRLRLRAALHVSRQVNALQDEDFQDENHMSNEDLKGYFRAFSNAYAYVEALKMNKSTLHLVSDEIQSDIDLAMARIGGEIERRSKALKPPKEYRSLKGKEPKRKKT